MSKAIHHNVVSNYDPDFFCCLLGNTYTSVGSHQEQSNSKPQNSPIIWLGKFVFDGLPSKLFNFKSPYSPLYWYNSLNDIAKTSTSNLIGNFG